MKDLAQTIFVFLFAVIIFAIFYDDLAKIKPFANFITIVSALGFIGIIAAILSLHDEKGKR